MRQLKNEVHRDADYKHELIEADGLQYCKHCGLWPENFHRPCTQEERDHWVWLRDYSYKDFQ